MIILTNTTDKIQVKLGSTITTNQLRCFSSFRDTTTTSITPLRNVLNTNGVSSSMNKIIDNVDAFEMMQSNIICEKSLPIVDR